MSKTKDDALAIEAVAHRWRKAIKETKIGPPRSPENPDCSIKFTSNVESAFLASAWKGMSRANDDGRTGGHRVDDDGKTSGNFFL